jgi:hypothetical protein
MEIPVLIEQVVGNGYRASSGEPLAFTVEASTRDAALQNLKGLIDRKLGNRSEMVLLSIASGANSAAGIHDANDPEVKAWIQAMAEYRDEVENDPDYR